VRGYLDAFHVADATVPLQSTGHSRRALTAVRHSGRLEVRTFTDLIRWPAEPTDDWRKGFLAGVFDAEGAYSHSVLRIAHTDHEMIKQTADCLRSLGFDIVCDLPTTGGGSSSVHVRGGLSEHFRFFHTVDPAIVGKRTVDGTAVMARAGLAVAAVEPLKVDLPMFDITTGTGDFIATLISIWTPATTSTPGSWSRSTPARCCARIWRLRGGSASTSRWAPMSTAISAPRGDTG
jgi:hypothetical protein